MGINEMVQMVWTADVNSIINPVVRVVAFTSKLLMSIVGVVALIIVGIKLSVDLIFINNKPLFYKIAEAKKMTKVEGESSPIARLAKLGTGFTNVVGTQGPVGIITYLLSLAPNFLFFSSYILPNGEIDQTAADNATLTTWAATKLWKQILAAVGCVFVASGLLFNILFVAIAFASGAGDIITRKASSWGNTVMTKVEGEKLAADGVKDEDLLANYVINSVQEAALKNMEFDGWKQTGETRTNLRKFLLEESKNANSQSSVFQSLPNKDSIINIKSGEHVNVGVNVSISNLDPSGLVEQYNTANATLNNTQQQKYRFFIKVDPDNGDIPLCSNPDAKTKYMIFEVVVQYKQRTAQINAYSTNAQNSGSNTGGQNSGGGTSSGGTGGGNNNQQTTVTFTDKTMNDFPVPSSGGSPATVKVKYKAVGNYPSESTLKTKIIALLRGETSNINGGDTIEFTAQNVDDGEDWSYELVSSLGSIEVTKDGIN